MWFLEGTTNLEAGHTIAVGIATVGAFEYCSIVRYWFFAIRAVHSPLHIFMGRADYFLVAGCALIDSADLNAFKDNLLREKVSFALDSVWCLIAPHEWFAHRPRPFLGISRTPSIAFLKPLS